MDDERADTFGADGAAGKGGALDPTPADAQPCRDRPHPPRHLTTGSRREGAHRFYERLGYLGTGLRYGKPLG